MSVIGYSPYEDAGNLGQGLGNAFAQFATQMPAMKAQQLMLKSQMAKLPYEFALMQAESAASNARAGEYKSHAGLYDAQTEGKKAETAGRRSFADKHPEGGDLSFIGNNPNAIAQAVIKMMSMGQSGLGVPGGQVNPANAMAATGMPQFMRPTVVPQNATAFGPGGEMMRGQASVPPQGQVFSPGFGNPQQGAQPFATNPNVRPTAQGSDPVLNFFGHGMQGGMGIDEIVKAFQMAQQMGARGGSPTNAPVKLPPKDKLVKGQQYNTAKGPATWDGEKFTQ